MIVRSAIFDDLPAIQELNLRLFEEECELYDYSLNLDRTMSELGRKYFADSIENDDACCFVALEEEEIVGYLVGYKRTRLNPCRNLISQAELENMFVSPLQRGQGIGSELVDAFVFWSKNNGIESLTVTASGGNRRGISFYEKKGFSVYDVTLERQVVL